MQRIIWFGMLWIVATLAIGNYSVPAYQLPTLSPTPHVTPAPVSIQPTSLTDVQSLMLDYADCLLACFWGLEPGQTSATDVITFTQPDFNVVNLSESHYFSYYFYENEDDTNALLLFEISTENERLSSLRVLMREPYRWLPEDTIEIDHLLATVGPPTETRITINVTRGLVFVTLMYAEVGSVAYSFGLEAEEELIRQTTPLLLCPRLGNNMSIDLRLPPAEFSGGANPNATSNRKRTPVEVLTGLDTATFFNTIIESPNDCIKMLSQAEIYARGYKL